MSRTKITPLKDGRIAVETPYNPQFVKRAKDLMGSWGDVAFSEGTRKAWVLRAEHQPKIEALFAELWPPEESKCEKTFAFTCGRGSYESPRIDGLDLVRFGRDFVGRINHPDIVEVIENKLKHGGSTKYPQLYGSLTVRCLVRSGAKAVWGGGEVEDLSQKDVSENTPREALDDVE